MNLFNLIYFLADVTTVILLIGVILGAVRYKRLEAQYRLLLFYLGIALTFHLGSFAMAKYINNSLYLIPLFGFFELIIFSVFYAKFMFKGKIAKFVLYTGGIGCALIAFECINIEYSRSEFQSYSRTFEAFIIVVFSMLYFFVKLSKGTDLKNSKLAVNTVVLIFFSLNLIFLLPINFLINPNSIWPYYFFFGYIIITVIFYAYITFLIWINGKTPKQLRSGLG